LSFSQNFSILKNVKYHVILIGLCCNEKKVLKSLKFINNIFWRDLRTFSNYRILCTVYQITVNFKVHLRDLYVPEVGTIGSESDRWIESGSNLSKKRPIRSNLFKRRTIRSRYDPIFSKVNRSDPIFLWADPIQSLRSDSFFVWK
jgi:hypothetical protein